MEYEDLWDRIPQRSNEAENEDPLVVELQELLLDLWDVFLHAQETLLVPKVAAGAEKRIVSIQVKIMTHIMNFGYTLGTLPLAELKRREELIFFEIDMVLDELSKHMDCLEAIRMILEPDRPLRKLPNGKIQLRDTSEC